MTKTPFLCTKFQSDGKSKKEQNGLRECLLRADCDSKIRKYWKLSGKGNLWIKVDDYDVMITEETSDQFRAFINGKKGRLLYASEESAIGVFDAIEKDAANRCQKWGSVRSPQSYAATRRKEYG